VDVLERIAARLEDPLLQGLAGLARGWMQLAGGELPAALASLRAVRRLGPDLHQHHFIDVYIALALYGLGEDAQAAAQFVEGLNAAAAVFNIRGVAGAIEGCGYLCARRGEWSDAARFLAVASRIRERTGIPLFNFWVPYHVETDALLRSRLGPRGYEAESLAGHGMRDEDAANEVRARLQLYAGGVANMPSGS
jgi:hypothetical protein